VRALPVNSCKGAKNFKQPAKHAIKPGKAGKNNREEQVMITGAEQRKAGGNTGITIATAA